MLPCVLFAGNASNTHSECRLKIRYRSGMLFPLLIKSLPRGKIYHVNCGLFHDFFLDGSRESEMLRKDTIAGNGAFSFLSVYSSKFGIFQFIVCFRMQRYDTGEFRVGE
jgi:hypothetical protein